MKLRLKSDHWSLPSGMHGCALDPTTLSRLMAVGFADHRGGSRLPDSLIWFTRRSFSAEGQFAPWDGTQAPGQRGIVR